MIGGWLGGRLLVETILVVIVLVDDHVHRTLFARRSQFDAVLLIYIVRRIVVELTHLIAVDGGWRAGDGQKVCV